MKKKGKCNKKEKENKKNSIINSPLMIQRKPTRPHYISEIKKPITEEKIKSSLQSKFKTHQEEDQIFNSVD
jgi:hypothetical protein